MSKRFFAAALVALAALSAAVLAQNNNAQAEAQRLLNEGARAYKEGRYDEARQHFEQAQALDPRQKLAPLFIARAVQQQYKPGVDTPENLAKAQETIELYKRVLASDDMEPKHKEDAFNAVAYLYRQMRDEEGERQWLLQRADDPNAPADKRADAYTILASKQWNCSYEITERKENKETVGKQGPGGAAVRYKRPLDQTAYDKAQGCVGEGLRLVEQAVSLNADNPNAWAYKTNLLREMAKIAEMNGDPAGKAEYVRQADEAEAEQHRLNGLAKERKAAEDGASVRQRQRAAGAAAADDSLVPAPERGRVMLAGPASDAGGQTPQPAQSAGPVGPVGRGGEKPALAPGQRGVITGGILNGKAVSKPAPAYPAEAKAARASGSVIVQVVVDEKGQVESAVASSGHPLLRAAAVEAVRQWRFTPTLLSGQPAKVRGNVVINFAAQ